MIFDGTSFNIDRGATTLITPALTWKKWGDGNFRARDRGAAEDVHGARFSLTGTYAQLTVLVNQLVVYRTYPTITCEAGEEIFGPHIDYSTPIDCVVTDFGQLKRKSFTVYSLEVELQMIGDVTSRYISGSTSTTTFKNDLYSLKTVDWNQTMTTNVTTNHKRSYNGQYTYIDQSSDVGLCKIRVTDFRMGASMKMGSIIKALLKDVRKDAIGWPGNGQTPITWGPTYPFGPRGPATPFCNVIDWQLGPRNTVGEWTLDLTFSEAILNFDGT